MKLPKLLHDIIVIDEPIEIKNLSLDSRSISAGDLFFAYPGTKVDGRQFIDQAIQKGACAVLAEGDAKKEIRQNVPIYYVPHLPTLLSEIAARFYEYPSKKMKIIGVTGTNGKTSCTHFIASCLQQSKLSCGVIGTLGSGLYGHIQAGGLTTPDPISLQKIFFELSKLGAKYVAMEMSSHSLDQGRASEVTCEVGVFTNLTRDHLDYHGTMEAYGNAKKKLFENEKLSHAVINAEDDFGRELITFLKPRNNVVAYSTTPQETTVPLVYTQHLQLDKTGIKAKVFTPWGEGELHLPLMGQFNLSNALAALTTLCLLDMPLSSALSYLSHLTSVPGRMQLLHSHPMIVVDYAHTPDALEKVLRAVRLHCQGKLFCVFGCGGDRDQGKRPLMARVAEQNADHVIVTSDNPRFEEPEKIIADIVKGFVAPEKISIELDRERAIHLAIQLANKEDCILIAGKGAETYQLIRDQKISFSDAAVVAMYLGSEIR